MTMDRSTGDPRFIEMVENWLREQGEILILFRHSRAAGAKDFFFRSIETFKDMLGKLSPETSVILFRKPQLPLRGLVDDAFRTGIFLREC